MKRLILAGLLAIFAAGPALAPAAEEEETALEPPELPAASGAEGEPEVSPEEETPAPPPDLPDHAQGGAAPPSASPPPPPISRLRERGSVLRGPEPGARRDEDLSSSPAASSRARAENPFRKVRKRALDYIGGALQAGAKGSRFGLEDAEDFLFDILETPDAIEQLYSLAVSIKDTENSMAIHLFNHAIYALKLSRGLKWSPERQVRLGVASMIHDIGMCRVPQKIRHKEGKLSPHELAEVQKHPEIGMRIIMENFGEPFRWLAEAIYHEHEREDGRGYPQGLQGNEISEYAKVIGLADTYEALTHNRPHRNRLLPHKAVQEIIQTQKASFHHRLLKAMLEELSVFSLNSFVRLNSNAIGRVAQTVPGQPLRPVIQLIFDGDGNEIMDERLIPLKDHPLLYIVDSMDESEIFR